jgi:hypothetical protein
MAAVAAKPRSQKDGKSEVRRRAGRILGFWLFGYFQGARRLSFQLGVQLTCDLDPLERSRQHPLLGRVRRFTSPLRERVIEAMMGARRGARQPNVLR